MREKIIFIGGGGHARVLLDIVSLNGGNVLGYVDLKRTDFPAEYLGTDEVLAAKYSGEDIVLVNGIGSVRRPEGRQKVFDDFKRKGHYFLSVIHPQAVIAKSAALGQGVQIMANAVVNPGSRIGDNAIINTSASIDHDCVVGAHAHIAPGVTLSGGVRVGQGSHIGTGAVIIQGIVIGDKVLIAAGEVVRADIIEGQTVYSI